MFLVVMISYFISIFAASELWLMTSDRLLAVFSIVANKAYENTNRPSIRNFGA